MGQRNRVYNVPQHPRRSWVGVFLLVLRSATCPCLDSSTVGPLVPKGGPPTSTNTQQCSVLVCPARGAHSARRLNSGTEHRCDTG
ncbi:hypothetical protein BV20DRAFT_586492 [Pilatotrama ljubarskyi]|nr:hypothetical protein BV20DRAFT_586492 [Pilatotrama ljubarskyi]